MLVFNEDWNNSSYLITSSYFCPPLLYDNIYSYMKNTLSTLVEYTELYRKDNSVVFTKSATKIFCIAGCSIKY